MSEANANPGSAFMCLLRFNREQGSGPGDSGVGMDRERDQVSWIQSFKL